MNSSADSSGRSQAWDGGTSCVGAHSMSCVGGTSCVGATSCVGGTAGVSSASMAAAGAGEGGVMQAARRALERLAEELKVAKLELLGGTVVQVSFTRGAEAPLVVRLT